MILSTNRRRIKLNILTGRAATSTISTTQSLRHTRFRELFQSPLRRSTRKRFRSLSLSVPVRPDAHHRPPPNRSIPSTCAYTRARQASVFGNLNLPARRSWYASRSYGSRILDGGRRMRFSRSRWSSLPPPSSSTNLMAPSA